MKFTRPYNYVTAAVLIVIYLAMPAATFARAAAMGADAPSVQTVYRTASAAPCGNCPCPDGFGSDCCDTTFCNCACHAPLSGGLRLTYAPLLVIHNFREQSWSLPQVYLPIFVPPQNPA